MVKNAFSLDTETQMRKAMQVGVKQNGCVPMVKAIFNVGRAIVEDGSDKARKGVQQEKLPLVAQGARNMVVGGLTCATSPVSGAVASLYRKEIESDLQNLNR